MAPTFLFPLAVFLASCATGSAIPPRFPEEAKAVRVVFSEEGFALEMRAESPPFRVLRREPEGVLVLGHGSGLTYRTHQHH